MSSVPGEFDSLSTVGGEPAKDRLCRIVSKIALRSISPPNFLYTGGRPGRFNSRGTQALYASEDIATAGAEADRYLNGGYGSKEIYWIEASALVLDITKPGNQAALGLVAADLHTAWRFAPSPTKTQRLGDAVSGQARLAGIRFEGNAALDRGFVGYNVVFFKTAFSSPNFLVIRDDNGNQIDRWG